jgi:hypothetical protein
MAAAPPMVLTEVFPLYGPTVGEIFGLYWTEQQAQAIRHYYAEEVCHDELSSEPSAPDSPVDWREVYDVELAAADRLPQALELFEATLASLSFDPDGLYVEGPRTGVVEVLRAELSWLERPTPIPSDPIAAVLRRAPR